MTEPRSCLKKNGATGGNHWLKSDGLSRRGHTGGIYRAHFQYAFLQQCCRLLIDRCRMNIRRVCILALFSALVAVLSVGNLMAQRIGFRVGIAPAFRGPVVTPGFGQPLSVPFGVASSTFGFPAAQMPFIVNPGGFGVSPGFGRLVFGCCAVPQVIVPGQVFFPGQIVAPGQSIVPGRTVFPGFFPGQILVPRQRAFVAGLPPIGTPRAQVVRQFGSPTVSIVTSTGETLHFSGGVTIFIQNGQVASPR